MGRYKYNSVYGLNPPTFHEVKELDESKFGSSSLNNAKTIVLDSRLGMGVVDEFMVVVTVLKDCNYNTCAKMQ